MKIVLKKIEIFVRTVAKLIEKKYNKNTFSKKVNNEKIGNSVKNTDNNRRKQNLLTL